MLNIRIHILLIQIHFKLTQALSESNSRAWAKRRAHMRHRCIIPIIIHVQVIEVVMVGHSPFDWFNASKVRRQQPHKTRFPFYDDNRRWPQSHHILIVRVSILHITQCTAIAIDFFFTLSLSLLSLYAGVVMKSVCRSESYYQCLTVGLSVNHAKTTEPIWNAFKIHDKIYFSIICSASKRFFIFLR